MKTIIKNAQCITPYRMERGGLLIEDAKITRLFDDDAPPADHEIDAQGLYVSPGFIDMHTQGGGHDYMDGTVEAFMSAARTHLQYGTTALLPTTLTCSEAELLRAFKAYRQAKEGEWDGLELLGLHLEGSYFSYEQRGAQDTRYLKAPSREHYLRLLDMSPDIRRMTVAPELDGALELGNELKRRGILASIGHTDTTYEQVVAACENGYSFLIHFYSGMSTIRRINAYRRLGAIESGYLIDDLALEIVADGKHLPPELLRLITKCKSWDRICLVTDSTRGAGMPEGSTPKLGSLTDGQDTVIADGVVFLPDRSAFAGSVCTADRCIRTMVQQAGIPLTDAVRMMTSNPAHYIGADDREGGLRAGMDADICIFDDEIRVQGVMVKGELLVDHLS